MNANERGEYQARVYSTATYASETCGEDARDNITHASHSRPSAFIRGLRSSYHFPEPVACSRKDRQMQHDRLYTTRIFGNHSIQ